ncbi:D-arabinono-1,4-lactone oxidase [Pseudolysinimonas yzui]|uniref:Xylitol oxidase n=1 Tax=Pseudolysinimonas yzui TaxID=2708254 RepID=A0A8J3M338_9MICO|nr:D-arabinono-1,4-lactone oxidase [Pseudolysinimonas yzui]GHF26544.1 xylitol oxidase [Pseudolysinimonas yzui]
MKNWAENIEYTATRVARPRNLDELGELVLANSRVKALGSRHSFNLCGDTTGTLLDMSAFDSTVEVHGETVRVAAGGTFSHVVEALARTELALPNLASLPHISVAGAVQTGTHGSGVRNPALSASVTAFEMMRSDGTIGRFTRGTSEFDACVVGIGALGIVTALELHCVPGFSIAQSVYLDMPWEAALGSWDELSECAYSVSVFTKYVGDTIPQVWAKRRVGDPEGLDPAALGARQAQEALHPLPGVRPDNVTVQFGEAGPWYERLPHFRSNFKPGRGDEIQSEYLVPSSAARDATEALRRIGDRISPLLHVSEIRTVAPDAAWLSPSGDRQSTAFHFTWQSKPREVAHVVPLVEQALAPFAPRPHWGKVFAMSGAELREVFPRLAEFSILARQLDPTSKFSNEYLDGVL